MKVVALLPAATMLLFMTLARAEGMPADVIAADDCTADVPSAPLADRTGTIASLQKLPDACLKRITIECNRATDEEVLDLGAAAMCSMGYEALLAKSFGGDFTAMLAWWQSEGQRPRPSPG